MVALHTVWYNFVKIHKRIACHLLWRLALPIGLGAWRISLRWSRPVRRSRANALSEAAAGSRIFQTKVQLCQRLLVNARNSHGL